MSYSNRVTSMKLNELNIRTVECRYSTKAVIGLLERKLNRQIVYVRLLHLTLNKTNALCQYTNSYCRHCGWHEQAPVFKI